MNKFKAMFLSLFGLVAFLAPITINGKTTIFLGHFKSFMMENFGAAVLAIILITGLITIVGTIIGLIKKDFKNEYLNELFIATPLNAVLRIGGYIMFTMVVFQVGPIGIIHEFTGGVMAGPDGLIQSLYLTFFAGIMLMPLLTKFGLVEFIGTLIAPFMRKVFKVPGYAAIDAMASFVGDGTIGIVVTDQQYQKGYYTQKEAALIASTFSIVGVSFAAVVAEMLGFAEIFGIFYATIFATTVIVAIIMARLPFKKFKDEYYDKPAVIEKRDESISSFAYGVELAEQAAAKNKILPVLGEAIKHVALIYVTFIPVIMFVGTFGLMIAEGTSFFTIISSPLIPVIQLFGFTHEVATQMAPALIVGFADMYLPAIFIEGSASELARYVVGVMAFAQLIFLSETGMVLVNSKIGFNFLDTVKLFFLRTILALPIVIGFGYLLVQAGIISS